MATRVRFGEKGRDLEGFLFETGVLDEKHVREIDGSVVVDNDGVEIVTWRGLRTKFGLMVVRFDNKEDKRIFAKDV